MAKKIGRPTKPYHPSWGGDPISGLARQADGRWRIIETGERFTEADEHTAIQRFLEWKAARSPGVVEMTGQLRGDEEALPPAAKVNGCTLMMHQGQAMAKLLDTEAQVVYQIPERLVWPWLKEQLIKRPEYVAKQIGLPELAGWKYLAIPQPPLKLSELVTAYTLQNPATEQAKRQALAAFKLLVDFAQAKTLDDLSQEKLRAFRLHIEQSHTLKSGGTIRAYFGRIRSVMSFGLKMGMDQQQIRSALDRCKVLWTAKPIPGVNPHPISKDHFHALLKAAGDGPWRAWLLAALNLCMKMEDLCDLRWRGSDPNRKHLGLNLDAATYADYRKKTKERRIPQVGVLWPETIAAIQKLPRRGPMYVFTSAHGTRYNRNTRLNDFAELRQKAGVPDSVGFSDIRDGSYGVACSEGPDERWARVLAGHQAHGLLDNYVLRNPQIAKPASDAVCQAYGPF